MGDVCCTFSTQRVSISLFVLFFQELNILVPKHQMLAHLYRCTANDVSAFKTDVFDFAWHINQKKSVKHHLISCVSVKRIHCRHTVLSKIIMILFIFQEFYIIK